MAIRHSKSLNPSPSSLIRTILLMRTGRLEAKAVEVPCLWRWGDRAVGPRGAVPSRGAGCASAPLSGGFGAVWTLLGDRTQGPLGGSVWEVQRGWQDYFPGHTSNRLLGSSSQSRQEHRSITVVPSRSQRGSKLRKTWFPCKLSRFRRAMRKREVLWRASCSAGAGSAPQTEMK